MREESNNVLGFGLFFFFIVLIVVVGSALLYFNTKEKREQKIKSPEEELVISDKMKIDKTKDFIYYTEEETISSSLAITSKRPVFNLNSKDATEVNEEIASYVKQTKASLKKESDPTCTFQNEENIYETNFLDYGIYEYQEYISLVIRESNYSCLNGFSASSKVKAYTFNVLTGEKIESSDLFSLYHTTLTIALEKIQESLSTVPNVKLEETINGLKENDTFVIYIDEFGTLVMNYVVKTLDGDYNDTITINE